MLIRTVNFQQVNYMNSRVYTPREARALSAGEGPVSWEYTGRAGALLEGRRPGSLWPDVGGLCAPKCPFQQHSPLVVPVPTWATGTESLQRFELII